MITRSTVASQLRDYLQHRTTRAALAQAKLAQVRQSETARDVSDRVEIAIIELVFHHRALGPIYQTKVDVVQAR